MKQICILKEKTITPGASLILFSQTMRFGYLSIYAKKEEILSGLPSACQNSLDPDQVETFLSGLVWVQIVCEGYQQMIKGNFLENFFQEYHQSFKLFGSRLGPAFFQAWSGSKLFVKTISR